MAAAGNSVRDRYLDVADRWDAADRHLPYTIVAVLIVLAMGSIIVPRTLSATDPLPPSPELALADEYVAAVSKVKGAKVPAPEKVVAEFGASGGAACSRPIPKLHAGLVRRSKARGARIDRVAQGELRAAMEVYCPKREARYATWLKKRRA